MHIVIEVVRIDGEVGIIQRRLEHELPVGLSEGGIPTIVFAG